MKMKNQHNQYRKYLLLTISAIFIFVAFSSIFAQGVGAKYGSRDPQPCKKVASPGKVPTSAEASASVICNGEGERGNESLYLYEDVKVTQIGKGSPYKPGVDFNVDDLDPKFLIYPIRGSFKKYQCGKPDPTSDGGKSCRLYDEQSAQGRCYKDTFGEWQCSMDDKTVGFNDYTEVAPPGKTNPADTEKPTAAKNTKQTVAAKNNAADGKDENDFPKPDFSEMEKWYQIIRYEYAPLEKKLHVFVKTSFEYRQRPTQFKMEFRDKNGMLLLDTTLSWVIGLTDVIPGEPAESHVNMPRESIMKQVATVKAVRILE